MLISNLSYLPNGQATCSPVIMIGYKSSFLSCFVIYSHCDEEFHSNHSYPLLNVFMPAESCQFIKVIQNDRLTQGPDNSPTFLNTKQKGWTMHQQLLGGTCSSSRGNSAGRGGAWLWHAILFLLEVIITYKAFLVFTYITNRASTLKVVHCQSHILNIAAVPAWALPQKTYSPWQLKENTEKHRLKMFFFIPWIKTVK